MSSVSPRKPETAPTRYQRRLSKPSRRLLTVLILTSTLRHSQLTTFLAHIGKSESLSQVALDIVSPFTTHTLKDREGNNKENLTKAVSPAPIGKSDTKSDFVMVDSSEVLKKVRINAADQSSSLSSTASSSKSKHVRSQSQPKVTAKSGSPSHFLEFYRGSSVFRSPQHPRIFNNLSRKQVVCEDAGIRPSGTYQGLRHSGAGYK